MLHGMQRFALLAAAIAVLAGCASPPRAPAVDPATERAKIRGLMPATIANSEGWATDIYAAFEVRSPNGLSYGERLDRARTEQDLSELFEDFIRAVPLGERLFGDLNPVCTGGPMQVSIAFLERQAKERQYPYPMTGTVRAEVFTRRGGLYFGIAHLFDYAAPYGDMVFRFADYNAGRFPSCPWVLAGFVTGSPDL